jgi:hypothetical protein
MKLNRTIGLAVATLMALSAFAAPQLKELLKIAGVGAAVKQFGPDINKAINGLTKHKDTNTMTTKVVPILSVGVGKGAIGAAQVIGPRSAVSKVQAVAQVEGSLFGEIRFKALIPISSKEVLKDIKRVDGVGVSGIVDLKL